eukprot:gnl/Spiro4/11560_TR6104_c0_g1_i1.p2 gnl/Spiro4/11560_TR6104_c0_g1~~gnl/Spiro4/11560_TR6104_c0_g1_i1.p2  ORF type:complete len:246 (-),score=67.01 gnl/Spiro4/11560_TR6104_c0_g1_i1:130-819(-)
MATLVLHGAPVSQPTRAIAILLAANGIAYENRVVNLLAGEQNTPEFLALNPCGAVPVISHGDLVLWEGAAILTYICNLHNLTAWYPTEPAKRAKVDQWLHWNHTATRFLTTQCIRPIFFGGKMEDALQGAQRVRSDVLPLLETCLTRGNQRFLASNDAPTVADLFIVTEFDQLVFFPPPLVEALGLADDSVFPHIKRWIQAVQQAVPAAAENIAQVAALVAAMMAAKKK